MTTHQWEGPVVPDLTKGWRLKMARARTGLGVRDFAQEIGVSHGTVTSAELDQRAVRPITMKMWAMKTGVDLQWLETGVPSSQPNDPDGGLSADIDNSSGSPAPPTSSYEGWRPTLVAA